MPVRSKPGTLKVPVHKWPVAMKSSVTSGVKFQHQFWESCADLHRQTSWLKVKLGEVSSSTVSILGHHHAGSSVCVNSVVIDVNKASLKKLILQLKCEVVLNFVHLTLRASQVDRKIRSSFPVLALPAGATFLWKCACLRPQTSIFSYFLTHLALFHRQILFRINSSPLSAPFSVYSFIGF